MMTEYGTIQKTLRDTTLRMRKVGLMQVEVTSRSCNVVLKLNVHIILPGLDQAASNTQGWVLYFSTVLLDTLHEFTISTV